MKQGNYQHKKQEIKNFIILLLQHPWCSHTLLFLFGNYENISKVTGVVVTACIPVDIAHSQFLDGNQEKEKALTKAEIVREIIKKLLSHMSKLNPLADDFSFLSFKIEKIMCNLSLFCHFIDVKHNVHFLREKMSEWKQKKKHSGMYKYYNTTLLSQLKLYMVPIFSQSRNQGTEVVELPLQWQPQTKSRWHGIVDRWTHGEATFIVIAKTFTSSKLSTAFFFRLPIFSWFTSITLYMYAYKPSAVNLYVSVIILGSDCRYLT